MSKRPNSPPAERKRLEARRRRLVAATEHGDLSIPQLAPMDSALVEMSTSLDLPLQAIEPQVAVLPCDPSALFHQDTPVTPLPASAAASISGVTESVASSAPAAHPSITTGHHPEPSTIVPGTSSIEDVVSSKNVTYCNPIESSLIYSDESASICGDRTEHTHQSFTEAAMGSVVAGEITGWSLYMQVPMEGEATSVSTIDSSPPTFFNEELTDVGDASEVLNPGLESSEPQVHNSLPLYSNAPLTVRESLASILSFSQTEHLTGVGLARLLQLINLHLPSPNHLPISSRDFYSLLENVDSNFEVFYYCNICWKERSSLAELCDSCNDQKKSVHYFISFSVSTQLKKMYSRPNYLSLIKHKDNRQKQHADHIEDIYDGKLYKDAEKLDLGEHGVTFTWNTDGVNLYDSSSFDLWPFYLIVNELPPQERFKSENIILAGVWGSKDKPHPNLFLKPVCLELNSLKTDGIDVFSPEIGNHRVKAFTLCGTCDSPAKALFFNFKGHMGYYSCPKCMIKGEKSVRTGDVMVFPHQKDLISRADLYNSQVTNSVTSKKDFEGVKGPTLLSVILMFSVITSTAIDSMHCIYLGVLKQLLNLWFNSVYSSCPFSMSKKVDEINKILSEIDLPHFVQRVPLGVDKLAFWKASLCRNFFFYMLIPVLKDVMNCVYYDHVMLLIEAVSLLNSNSISDEDLLRSNDLLCKFVEDFESLYGIRHMSSNVHLLRHLSETVRNLGPLWANSCFWFEDLNGRLAQLVHGTRHSVLQIARNFPLLADLPTLITALPNGSPKDFCEKMSVKYKRLHVQDRIAPKIFTVGCFDSTSSHPDLISDILSNHSVTVPKFVTFSRLYNRSQLYVASSYSRGSRVSSFIKYHNNGEKYGEVLTFVKVFAEDGGSDSYWALIRVANVSATSSSLKHLKIFTHTSDTVDFVPVTSLACVCFRIKIRDTIFLGIPVNDMELE